MTTREIDRFIIGDVVSTGGMGAVHRGTDKESGARVAIKLLGRPSKEGEARFLEEAHALAELDHPNIVRHLAHGLTSDGEAYLAMEWLDGEDLADRLLRGRLTIEETLAVAKSVASALAASHERHIVHRDVKPSNIFLVNRDPASSRLIDFGVARRDTRRERLTATGLSVGTLGYMAPEQARGGPDVGAPADVFALGCVLFECLTGKPVFEGPAVAVLAKILFYDPPRVRDALPDVPRDLDELIARMLAKEPTQRPANGAAVERALSELSLTRKPPTVSGTHGSLSSREQRIVGIVLGDRTDASISRTLTPDEIDAELTTARAVVMPFGADAACTANGAIVVTLSGAKSATDLATRSATVALALRDTLPHLDIAIATGRAEVNRASPVGPAIDRAAALLAQRDLPASSVRIDDVTAGLLEGRFVTKEVAGARLLVGRAEDVAPRTLLGRATECVGREKELALLEATFDECRTESVSRSVFVSAPAGTGKSRLMRELVTRLTSKHELLVLTARGDPVGAGFALGPIRQLLRMAFPAPRVLQVLARSRLRRITDARRADRLAAFLGELAGETVEVPPELRAARNDPRLMREWQKLAFREWIASECEQHPVMLVFEDLQWGDAASIAFVDDALRALENRPLFVLTLARPDASAGASEMGPARARQTLSLAGLGRRACEALVRASLPSSISDETITRIVDRSDGNAFFLEELVRSVAEGRDEWPETVVAMVQMRLEALDGNARRFLRAASVFGEHFRLGGVAALLGEADPEIAPALVQNELIEPARGEPVDREQSMFRFRHGLVRDAAYAMLTEEDRVRGHRIAATWLEQLGGEEPSTLAEHWLLAKDSASAIPWLVRAAEAAVESGDSDGALRFAARAIDLGVTGESRGLVRAAQGHAFSRRGDFADGIAPAKEAVSLVREGSVAWWRAVATATMSAANVGDVATIVEIIGRVTALTAPFEPTGPLAFAIAVLTAALLHGGQRMLALAMEERLAGTVRSSSDEDPMFDGWRAVATSTRAMYADGDPARGVRAISDARACFRTFQDPIGMAYVHAHSGVHLTEAGAFEKAVAAAEDAIAAIRSASFEALLPWAELQRIRARVYAGQREGAAEGLAKIAAESSAAIGLVARAFGAEVAFLEGRLDEAQITSDLLLGIVPAGFLVHMQALGNRAHVALARGAFDEALAFSERAIALEANSIFVAQHASLNRFIRISALSALGRKDEANEALAEAKGRIQKLAAGFDNPALGESFRTRVEVNARTLALEVS